MDNGIYLQIAVFVDLDVLHIFCNLILTFISYSFLNIRRKGDRNDRHNFKRGPPKDHSDKVCLKLVKWFLTRIFLNDFLVIN